MYSASQSISLPNIRSLDLPPYPQMMITEEKEPNQLINLINLEVQTRVDNSIAELSNFHYSIQTAGSNFKTEINPDTCQTFLNTLICFGNKYQTEIHKLKEIARRGSQAHLTAEGKTIIDVLLGDLEVSSDQDKVVNSESEEKDEIPRSPSITGRKRKRTTKVIQSDGKRKKKRSGGGPWTLDEITEVLDFVLEYQPALTSQIKSIFKEHKLLKEKRTPTGMYTRFLHILKINGLKLKDFLQMKKISAHQYRHRLTGKLLDANNGVAKNQGDWSSEETNFLLDFIRKYKPSNRSDLEKLVVQKGLFYNSRNPASIGSFIGKYLKRKGMKITDLYSE